MIDILFYLGCLLPLGIVLFCISIIMFPCRYSEDSKGSIIGGIGVAMMVIGSFAIIIGWLS